MSSRTGGADSEHKYFGFDIPFMRHVGLEPVSLANDVCVTTLPLIASNMNSRGIMQGGVLMSVLDFTLSAAARAHAPLAFSVATIEMTTHFLNEAKTRLTIEGRCMRRGRSITFCEGEIRDQDGLLLATARGVFKLIGISQS